LFWHWNAEEAVSIPVFSRASFEVAGQGLGALSIGKRRELLLDLLYLRRNSNLSGRSFDRDKISRHVFALGRNCTIPISKPIPTSFKQVGLTL
jgi:hypothetical protein